VLERLEVLITAMDALREAFELDTVRVAKRVEDGHTIALTLTQHAPLVIEREDGYTRIVTKEWSS
jgi:ribosomal protein L17